MQLIPTDYTIVVLLLNSFKNLLIILFTWKRKYAIFLFQDREDKSENWPNVSQMICYVLKNINSNLRWKTKKKYRSMIWIERKGNNIRTNRAVLNSYWIENKLYGSVPLWIETRVQNEHEILLQSGSKQQWPVLLKVWEGQIEKTQCIIDVFKKSLFRVTSFGNVWMNVICNSKIYCSVLCLQQKLAVGILSFLTKGTIRVYFSAVRGYIGIFRFRRGYNEEKNRPTISLIIIKLWLK